MTIYSRESCVPCHQLKKYLNSRGVLFTEKSVDDDHNLKELIEITGTLLLPTVVKGNNIIRGLNYGAIAKIL